MTDNWYCRLDGREFGPMPFEELTARLARRTLQPDDAVRFGAGGVWLPAAEFALGGEEGQPKPADENSAVNYDEVMGALTSEPVAAEVSPLANESAACATEPAVPETSAAHAPPESYDGRAPAPSRGQSWVYFVWATAVCLVALLGLLYLGTVSHRRAFDERALPACQRVEDLYQQLAEARTAGLDANQWRRTVNDIHERRRQIQRGVSAAPPDSAAHDVARAALMLETMAELPRDAGDGSSHAEVAYHAAELRFQAALERAQRKLGVE